MLKPTGWLSNRKYLVDVICSYKCNGKHEHEHCMSGNSQRAQVYTRKLAQVIISAVIDLLQEAGDMRFAVNRNAYDFHHVWITNVNYTPPGTCHNVLYLDAVKDVEAWRPLLEEAQKKIANKSAVLPTSLLLLLSLKRLGCLCLGSFS